MNIISLVWLLFISPSKFFEGIKSDKDANKAVWFSVVSAVIFIASYFIQSYLQYNPEVPIRGLPDVWYSQPVVSALMVAFYLLSAVALIPLSHAIAQKVGGKGTWEQTVKAIFYSSGIGSLLGVIPVIGTALSLYCFYVNYRGLRVLHSMTKKNAIILISIGSLLSIGVILFAAVASYLVFSMVYLGLLLGGFL